MKFVTQHDWQDFSRLRVNPPGQKVTFFFRCEKHTRIYVTEDGPEEAVLCALGEGDLEVQLVGWGPAEVYAMSDGQVWVRSEQIDQTTKAVYGTVFTEPLQRREVHPEIRRMQEMVRHNELVREQQMREWRASVEARIENAGKLIERASDDGQEMARSEGAGGSEEESGNRRGDGESGSGEQEGDDVAGAEADGAEGSDGSA